MLICSQKSRFSPDGVQFNYSIEDKIVKILQQKSNTEIRLETKQKPYTLNEYVTFIITGASYYRLGYTYYVLINVRLIEVRVKETSMKKTSLIVYEWDTIRLNLQEYFLRLFKPYCGPLQFLISYKSQQLDQ